MSSGDFLEFSLNNSSPYSIILKRNNIILHQLPTSFHLNQVWIKFSTGQCVKEVLCDIAPMDSSHLLLGWAWLRFKTLNLDECSLYLRHEGHKMKLKFMTPRQVSKDQHSLKEKIEKKNRKRSNRNYKRKGKWRKRKGTRGKDDGKFICQCFFFYSLWCHLTGTKG